MIFSKGRRKYENFWFLYKVNTTEITDEYKYFLVTFYRRSGKRSRELMLPTVYIMPSWNKFSYIILSNNGNLTSFIPFCLVFLILSCRNEAQAVLGSGYYHPDQTVLACV